MLDNAARPSGALVCTNPQGKRHENLAWLHIPANLPGITIQHMHMMMGIKNAVFFDNVRVPVENRLGEEGEGFVRIALVENEQRIRQAARNIRRDIKEAVEKLEKEKKISEDEKKRTLEELEKVTHQETKKIEDLSAAKEKEILEVK